MISILPMSSLGFWVGVRLSSGRGNVLGSNPPCLFSGSVCEDWADFSYKASGEFAREALSTRVGFPEMSQDTSALRCHCGSDVVKMCFSRYCSFHHAAQIDHKKAIHNGSYYLFKVCTVSGLPPFSFLIMKL